MIWPQLCSLMFVCPTLSCFLSLYLPRSCDWAVPSQTPGGGAESAALAVAPPGHVQPQRDHSWPGRKREGRDRQPVPSPLRPDGVQPERVRRLPARQRPQRFKWVPEELILKVKPNPNTTKCWKRRTLTLTLLEDRDVLHFLQCLHFYINEVLEKWGTLNSYLSEICSGTEAWTM